MLQMSVGKTEPSRPDLLNSIITSNSVSTVLILNSAQFTVNGRLEFDRDYKLPFISKSKNESVLIGNIAEEKVFHK